MNRTRELQARLLVMVVLVLSLIAPVALASGQQRSDSGVASVAFVGADNAIWVAGADGGDAQRVTGEGVATGLNPIALSPNGSYVAYKARGEDIRIWTVATGAEQTIAGYEACVAPEFDPSNDRIFIKCAETEWSGPVPGLVVSMTLTGDDPRIELPGLSAALPGPLMDVRLSDGSILTSELRDTDQGQGSLSTTLILDANRKELAAFEGVEVQQWGRQALFEARFARGENAIIAQVCVDGCIFNQESVYHQLLIGFDGKVIADLTPEWLVRIGGTRLVAAMSTETSVQPPVDSPDASASADSGLIAYIGQDGNLWLMHADGRGQRQITEDAELLGNITYSNPAWSHDGTMLTFEGPAPGNSRGIYVWQLDAPGRVLVESTEHCDLPVFAGDNQRVIYRCTPRFAGPPVSSADPRNGEVLSSALDGTDQRIEVPREDPASFVAGFSGLDVRPQDGSILVWEERSNETGGLIRIRLYDATFSLTQDVEVLIAAQISQDAAGPLAMRFMPDGQRLASIFCTAGCLDSNATTEQFEWIITDLDGMISERFKVSPELSPNSMTYFSGFDVVPSGEAIVMATSILRGVIGIADTSGTWAELADGAMPARQPGKPASEETVATAKTVAPMDASEAVPDEPGWVAYVSDGIWMMRPDGSDARQLVPALEAGMWADAGQLAWSHDGTMLAFNGPTTPGAALDATRGVWVYRDGQARQLPNTGLCAYPAFSADNTRVFYTCWGANTGDPSDEQLAHDPQMGFLSSSALDGSDQRIEISYADMPLSNTWLADDGTYLQAEHVDVNPDDGSFLIAYAGVRGESHGGGFHLDSTYAVLAEVPSVEQDRSIRFLYNEFLPDGELAVIQQCREGCENDLNTIITDVTGSELWRPTLAEAIWTFSEFDLAPDAMSAIGWTGVEGAWVISEVGLSGQFTGLERKPEWQPVSVQVASPVGPPMYVGNTSSSDASIATPTQSPDMATTSPMLPPRVKPGRIAFIHGESVYTVNPDGSDPQAVAPDLPFDAYADPSWSSDGMMLAFAGPQAVAPDLVPYQGIWILRDGQLSMLPNTPYCLSPRFSADGKRVYYHCQAVGYQDTSPVNHATNPHLAYVASSALDGSDQRVELTVNDIAPGGGDFLAENGDPLTFDALDINPVDGSILVRLVGYDHDAVRYAEAFHFTADFEPLARITPAASDSLTSEDGFYHWRALAPLSFFLPDGSIAFQLQCEPICANGYSYMVVDVAGKPLELPLVEQALDIVVDDMALAPDGSLVAMQGYLIGSVGLVVLDAQGNVVSLGEGRMPAWQPVPLE